MTADSDAATRAQILALLDGGNAHMNIDEAVADFPTAHFNTRPSHVPYTPWHLLEHIRLTQRDILDFIQDPGYKEARWPEDYWPAREADADETAWNATLTGIRSDLAAIRALVADPQVDMHARLANADADHYTLLREVLVVADHNAYHIGEFAILRQVMGTWPADHES